MFKKIFQTHILMCIAIFFTCSHVPQIAGGSSQQGNGIVAGRILDKYGNPAANTKVILFPATYNPVAGTPIPDSCIDTTNSNGEYSLKVPNAALKYQIVAQNLNVPTVLLITDISIDSGVTHIADARLSVSGALKVTLPGNADLANGYIYIPGTNIFAKIATSSASGSILLNSVPAGIIPVVDYAVANIALVNNVRYNISVIPSDTVAIVNPGWHYMQSLYLNTTSSGAYVTGNVVNFPILVRLAGTNFTFSNAQSFGADLRFTKADNTPLSYEIAQWDSVHASAEIWVKIDTVYGNDSTHFINMYWGNSAATDSSNSAAVFDTGNGFSGVWHLDTSCLDATINHYNGTNYGASDVAGIIGTAKKFDGTDSIRISGLLGSPQVFTFSAWVNIDTTVPLGQEVISIGDAAILRAEATIFSLGTHGSIHRYNASNDSLFFNIGSGLYLAHTGWRYLTYSFDKNTKVHSLYIDGALRATSNSSDTVCYTGVGSNTFIGAHGNGKLTYSSHGTIDEVRVCNVARSADWIKLCYMNQMQSNVLVVFK